MNLRSFSAAAVSPRWWRGLGSAEQLAFYIRWSVQIMMFSGILYLVVAPVLWSIDLPMVWLVVHCVFAVVVGAIGFLVIRDTEQLRVAEPVATKQMRNLRFRLGSVLTIAVPVVLWIVARLSDSDGAVLLFLVWLFVSSGLLGLIYLPHVQYRWVVAVVIGAVSAWLAYDNLGAISFFIAVFMLFTAVTSYWTVSVGKDLENARLTEAAFQVSEERLRFAQELHDTMGQHLAAISLKAEVARALAKRNDPRLDSELQQLQELTRTSMSDMRRVAAGYRRVNLTTELSSAERILRDAGIETSIDGSPDQVPEQWRETAAWFLREGATNILRHANATYMSIIFDAHGVELLNDGVVKQLGELGGLSALRRRVMDAGGQLTVAVADGSYRVRLDFCEDDNQRANCGTDGGPGTRTRDVEAT